MRAGAGRTGATKVGTLVLGSTTGADGLTGALLTTGAGCGGEYVLCEGRRAPVFPPPLGRGGGAGAAGREKLPPPTDLAGAAPPPFGSLPERPAARTIISPPIANAAARPATAKRMGLRIIGSPG